jgi:integrase
VSKQFKKRAKQAGLPPIRLHDLRHSHATHLLEAGVHPKVVQERLGHANISMTLDTYSHAVPAMEEDAAAKVAALVLGS